MKYRPLKIFFILIISTFMTLPPAAFTEPTHIVIRVKAKDAKFIGTSMGGAKIIIRNVETGKILANGLTSGGTGNTQILMSGEHKRYQKLSEESTASYETTLDIKLPVLVSIEAQSSITKNQNNIQTSTRLWLIPGKNIDGDGIILEMPGFVVTTLAPQNNQTIQLQNGKATVDVKSHVVMMCGCPITPNGLWDANQYEVKAIIHSKNGEITSVPLKYAGTTSMFSGSIAFTQKGQYEVFLYAFDPVTGNSGVDKITVIVT